MRTLFLLPLILAIGCSAPDDTGTDDIDTTVSDDGGGTDDPVLDPGFSATIVAERPAFMPTFKIQPADDDRAERIPMTCGGNSICTAELDEPGNWRLWGTAEGWTITYNKVVSVTEDGERAEVALDQFGDYGVDLSGRVYESEGDHYEVNTIYKDGRVLVSGLAPGLTDGIPMLGDVFMGDAFDEGYTIDGSISADLTTITLHLEGPDSTESYNYTLVVE